MPSLRSELLATKHVQRQAHNLVDIRVMILPNSWVLPKTTTSKTASLSQPPTGCPTGSGISTGSRKDRHHAFPYYRDSNGRHIIFSPMGGIAVAQLWKRLSFKRQLLRSRIGDSCHRILTPKRTSTPLRAGSSSRMRVPSHASTSLGAVERKRARAQERTGRFRTSAKPPKNFIPL
ncbi:hypothetical protein FA95DRAFT_1200704 [Auriscalpium vulgare]|uniref:Uncharacterized protein n=1 Tax=Auriscalpium vulgare TaxID=40419 RepID=A0ACB8RV98_9AGAM|nr:hypothetical protein FA95DRAFT_1200704 [Auriscalpium vulgare]